MPRVVENFWVRSAAEGRKTPISFGSRGKDNGLRLSIFMRVEGEVVKVLYIEGFPSSVPCVEGDDISTCKIQVIAPGEGVVYEREEER